jgi:23S rRNA (adenine2503-C2)-methyltransferase
MLLQEVSLSEMPIKAGKKNIRDLSLDELKAFFVEKGDKPYRAKQVWEWLWQKSARSFDEMTSLSKETRDMLHENFSFPVITLDTEQISSDRTIKDGFRLYDSDRDSHDGMCFIAGRMQSYMYFLCNRKTGANPQP